MPICSYLVYPKEGMMEQLMLELEERKEFTLHPAENKNVLIVITDTENRDKETQVQDDLNNNSNIDAVSLCFGDIEEKSA